MHILITNDDGVEAPGLAALHAALAPMADISVVAPRTECSLCGHAVRVRGALHAEPVPHPTLGRVWAVDGSSADCVRLAISILLDQRVDWVVSGINRGANVGVDVYYSGTVAAAREAAIHGLPAMAFSQFTRGGQPVDWVAAQRWCATLFGELSGVRPRPPVWNVTFPYVVDGHGTPDVVVARLSTDPLPLRYRALDGEPSGRRGFEYDGVYAERVQTAGTDVHALFTGKIAVTPLSLDATSEDGLRATLG